jgi:hypothetical protein
MKSSIPIGPEAFRQGSRTKTNQILIWPTWHHFGGKKNWSGPKKKSLKESSWLGEPKCKLGSKVIHFFVFCFYFHVFFYLCCLNFVIVENMLWIEDIVASTSAPSFSINSRIDIASFVHPHKVVVRSIFWTFSNAQNEGELEGGAWSGRLKHQFSQMERDMNLQENPAKLVLISKKKARRKIWLWWKTKMKKLKKIRWTVKFTPHCSKKRNGAWIYQKCEKTRKKKINPKLT